MRQVAGQGLAIMNIHPQDEDIYTCEASNPGGHISWSASLSVQVDG